MVELALQHKALPNKQDLQGQTPLSIATKALLERGDQVGYDIVNVLLEHGALFTKETLPLLDELRNCLWYDEEWHSSKYRAKI